MKIQLRSFVAIFACMVLVGGIAAERIASPRPNPLLRLFAPEGMPGFSPAMDRRDTAAGLAEFARRFESAGQAAPEYLRLVRDEYSATKRASATFAVGCYWEGERDMGGLPGVLATRTGMLGHEEVVQLSYDPRVASTAKLSKTVQGMKCFRKVCPPEAVIASDPEQQHYLAMRPEYAYLPLTAGQATRINSALGCGENPDRFLSPVQFELKDRLARFLGSSDASETALSDLSPERSPAGLARYLRSLEAVLAAQGH